MWCCLFCHPGSGFDAVCRLFCAASGRKSGSTRWRFVADGGEVGAPRLPPPPHGRKGPRALLGQSQAGHCSWGGLFDFDFPKPEGHVVSEGWGLGMGNPSLCKAPPAACPSSPYKEGLAVCSAWRKRLTFSTWRETLRLSSERRKDPGLLSLTRCPP